MPLPYPNVNTPGPRSTPSPTATNIAGLTDPILTIELSHRPGALDIGAADDFLLGAARSGLGISLRQVGVLEEDAAGWRVEVVVLAAADGPEERRQRGAGQADRQRQDDEDHVHDRPPAFFEVPI